jgi:lysozyme family protein
MGYPSFAILAPSYARMWAELEPTPAHIPALKTICEGLAAHTETYKNVSAAVWGRPELWFIVALIDQMEGGGGCRTHLHNGDPLTGRTVSVPAGRPPGEPPFTFEQSAIDALIFDDLDKVQIWTIERIAYQLEKYNGPGYLDKPIVSPYLASWSNKYTKGKFVADHVYDPEAVSQQPGALTILKVLIMLDPEVAGAIAPQPKESPVTTSPPLAPTQIPTPVAPPFDKSSGLPALDLRKVEVDLQMIAPAIEMIAGFVPPPYGLAVKVAIPAIEALLKIGADVETAPDLAGKFAAIEGHLHDIADAFGQVKGLFPPPAKGA